MAITAKVYRPMAKVVVYTEQGKLTLRSKPATEGDKIKSDIMAIHTENDSNTDAGTFQLSLVNRNNWDKKLITNDMVEIHLWRTEKGSKNAIVMYGLIDDVRKGVVIQNGHYQRSVIVTGRNFSKVFINFMVGYVMEVNAIVPNLGWLEGRITFTQKSAAENIRAVIEKLVYKYTKYKFSNGKSLKDVITLKLSSRKGEKLFDDQSFINYQGNIYSFLKELSDDPFNEMFWEVYDNKNCFVVRETPFNKDPWNKLTRHDIKDSEIISYDKGRSDLEAYSLFSVGLQAFFGDIDWARTINMAPLWNEDYFNKFGLKRLDKYTYYVGISGDEGSSDLSDQLKKYQEDIYNWNIQNPNFYNGNITIRGRNDIKLGDRVLVSSDEDNTKIEYYVESVSHSFINNQGWTTSLGITRGMPDSGSGRFKDPWGTGKRYEGDALGTSIFTGDSEIAGNSSLSFFNDPNISPNAEKVLSVAQSYEGFATYKMGGGRNNSDIEKRVFDCSSFVNHVFDKAGFHLMDQSSVTTTGLAKLGSPVSITSIKPGDLIFFNTYKKNGHVGIYINDGKFISCASDGVVVDDVTDWQNEYGIGEIRRVI